MPKPLEPKFKTQNTAPGCKKRQLRCPRSGSRSLTLARLWSPSLVPPRQYFFRSGSFIPGFELRFLAFFFFTLAPILFLAQLTGCGGKGTCVPQIPGDNRIIMSTIGQIGRFGNQMYQYIFLKTYAKRHGLTVETPDWIGNQLFGLKDPRISTRFCSISESPELMDSYMQKSGKRFTNLDFMGYYQIHTSMHRPDKEYIQSLFNPTPEVEERVTSALKQIRGGHKTLVSIHLRRGDFGQPPFYISPTEWYLDWLNKTWPELIEDGADPVLFIASDDLDLVTPDFRNAGYQFKTIRDVQVKIENADFYPEYYILTQSDILAISNSTFSTSSALLNQVATRFYRPGFNEKKLVSFNPWDTLPWEIWDPK